MRHRTTALSFRRVAFTGACTAALLSTTLLFGCGGKRGEPSSPAPRTALEKRAALLNRQPTALEKDISKTANVVRDQLAPFGYTLDSDWIVSSTGNPDPSCRNLPLVEKLVGLLRQAIEQGERGSWLRVNRLQLALTTCETGYDSDAAHRGRLGMGTLLIQLGQPLSARKVFEEERAWAQSRYGRGSEQEASVFLHRIAALWTAGVLSEAYAFFEEHHAAIKKHFPQNFRSTTASFGVLSCDSGRTSLSLEYAKRMQQSYNPDRHAEEGLSISVGQIAGCLERRGQKEQAKLLFDWALSKQRKAEARATDPTAWSALQILNENGLLFEAMGDFENAEREYERLKERALRSGLPREPRELGHVITAWTSLARVQLEQGKLSEAAANLKDLRQLPSEMYIDVLGPKVKRGLGKYREALAELDVLDKRSQGWGDWLRLSFALERARILWADGQLEEARDIFQESLARGLGHLDTRSVGSEAERRRTISHLRPAVEALVSMNLRSGPKDIEMTEEAFATLLITKGVLLDSLSADYTKLRKSSFSEDRELLQRLQKKRGDLARGSVKDSDGSHFAERLELEALEARARERSQALGGDPTPITPEDVKQSLMNGETFIEFFEFSYEDPKIVPGEPSQHMAAYVANNSGPIRVFDLGPSKKIKSAIEAARKEIAGQSSQAPRTLQNLGSLVFGPLESVLSTTHTLRLAPDGALHRIPFSALRDERGKYYLDRFLITYIGTGREWARLAKRRTSLSARPGSRTAAKLKPVVVANPEFGTKGRTSSGSLSTSPFSLSTRGQQSIEPLSHDWQALPGTAKEAQRLSQLFPEGSLFTRHDATESAVKAVTHPDILHIASHGYFLPPTTSDRTEQISEDPLLHSGLVLAFANSGGRGSDDGFLTALEVAGLDLGGTQVVTLSACETGLGEVNGEGVFGLRRSLAIAGAASQLLSLWKVSDNATLRLMTDFYNRIARGESRQAALTSVMRAMAKDPKLRHPYYWSAFVLSGDPGVLSTPSDGE